MWCVVGHSSSDTKEFEEIIELAVNVSAYCDWCPDGLDVGFW